jgi:hypothetical protein
VQPASIGFVGEQYKVTQGESLAATTQFGAGPLLQWRKSLYDDLLKRRGYPELEAWNVTPHETGAAARAARNEVRIRSGQCTPNEARAEEGLEPLPGGDTLFLAGGLVPLEQAASAGQPDAPPAEAEPTESEAVERALRQWERKALNRLRAGKSAACAFESGLPATLSHLVQQGLDECVTAEAVRSLFRSAGERGKWRNIKGRPVFIKDKENATGGEAAEASLAGGVDSLEEPSRSPAFTPAEAAQQVVEIHNRTGEGCSFSLFDGDLWGKPLWAVAPYPERSLPIPGQQISEAVIARYIEKNADLLNDPEHYMGTWYNKNDGQTYLDVSVAKPTQDEAKALAVATNQIAIFGLEHGVEVQTGGTGKA